MATKDRTALKDEFKNGNLATGERFADLIDSMKVVQEPVADPAASGTSLSFIDSISQDADGKITATKKTLDLANAHELNPFKGWYKTGDTLPTDGFDGAYLYFKDNSELTGQTTIYRWNGTTYADTGTVVDTSNVQTFETGQAVNGTGIKDINGNNDQTAAGVLSAEAGKIIGDRVFGESTKAAYTPVSGYVVGRTGGVAPSSTGLEYCEVELAEDVHDVKFYGVVLSVSATGVTAGYAFGHYTDPSDTSTWVSDYASGWDVEGSNNGLKEYVVHKPSMATHFRTCCKLSYSGGAVVLDDANFYLYLQTGYPLVDKAQLDTVKGELNGNFVQKSINLLGEATEVKVSLDPNAIYTNPNAGYRSYEVDLTNYIGVNRVITIVGGSDSSTYFFFSKSKINDESNRFIAGSSVPKAKCGVPTGESLYRTGMSFGVTKIIDITDDAKYLYIYKNSGTGNYNYTPQSVILSMKIHSGGLTDKVTDDIVRANEDNVNLEIDFANEVAKITHYTGTNAVVVDGMTLTDIFEKNNIAPIYPGFDNGSFAPMVVGKSAPYITSEKAVTGRYSLKSNDVNGVKSSQIKTLQNITPAMQIFAACKINVTSYTAGRYGINAGAGDNAQVYKDSTTDGWETISDIITTGTGTALWFGGWSSSEGVCYIDSPVVVNMNIFTVAPTVEQLTEWYEQYIAYKQTFQEINIVDDNMGTNYADADCIARFVEEMNKRAERIGCTNTNYTSPSGYYLPTSTATDYIKVMIEAMSHPKLMKIWDKSEWTINYYDASSSDDTTIDIDSSVVNPTHYNAGSTPRLGLETLLANYTILGGKTGTTAVGGVMPSETYVHNLCIVAEKDGKYVIAVLFGGDASTNGAYGDYRFHAMKRLLDNAFGLLGDENYTTTTVLYEPTSQSGFPETYPQGCAAIEVPKILPSMLQDWNPTLLYSENPTREVYTASTSKIMCCMLVEELLDLHQKLLYKSGDDIGHRLDSGNIFDAGDIASVEDMMMAAMLPSSNGCATCLGRVAGRLLLNYDNGKAI